MQYLRIKHENDAIFREGHFPEMRSVYYRDVPLPPPPAQPLAWQAHMQRTDAVTAILSHRRQRVCALNFANAMVPGGGYILGGNAQEEALCRASLLYYTIRAVTPFYRRNRLHILPDYTDGIILSKDVPVIRNADGERLSEPMVCDFITCPAVNRVFARYLFSGARIKAVMERRIARIIALACTVQPEVLILGAFGCGAFGNRREDVYPMFARALGPSPDCEVIFADPAFQMN